MKVLLLCLAFAAVSLAMPVAEEKPDVGAPPPPIAVKADEAVQADAPATTVEEKKPEATPEAKEAEKQPEVKKETAEIKPDIKESEAPKPEESPASKSDEIVLETKSAEAEPAPKPEEPKPEISQPAEATPEAKSADAEAKPAEEPKPTEVPAIVNEVPKDASAKSAVPEEPIDIVNAVKVEAAVADDLSKPDVLIPAPEKKTDLPVVPGVDAEASKDNKDKSPAPVQELAKSEEKKPEDSKVENKVPEPAADAAPAAAPAADKPEETAVPSDADNLRVVRGTVAEIEKEKAAEVPKAEDKPEAAKEVKPIEVVEQKKETAVLEPQVPKVGDSAPIDASKATESKLEEKPQGDAAAQNSEESQESSEKKPETADKKTPESDEDSSEESLEKP